MINKNGYLKLIDFGSSKIILRGQNGKTEKTKSFVGTTEYVAPEILLNLGHDYKVDYWSLGVLIYEMLEGRTPFYATDHDHQRDIGKIYANILKGYEAVDRHHRYDLIEKLCQSNPEKRINYEEILNHTWFEHYDILAVKCQCSVAPFIPDSSAIRQE